MFEQSNHLSSFNPYYHIDPSGKIRTFSNFNDAYSQSCNNAKIDPIAVAELLFRNHFLGDRTIIDKIKRTPWLGKPNQEYNGWAFYELQKHKELVVSESEIADKLFELLCDEISSYVIGKNNVGMLLSGGMDSRIVAGILDYLIKTKKVDVKTVTAYTWGSADSRDAVYAKEIAKRLNWDWKHYTITSNHLLENMKIAGFRGCEYSGIHLHAIPQITQDIDNDVLLAGSYGDSIGRGEYSGIHFRNLRPINQNCKNFAWLLNHKTYITSKKDILDDLKFYHSKFAEKKKYQQYELDYQIHYMRRMLNPCLEMLNEKVPLFQVFTNPAVFQYMWSIHPNKRNNEIYRLIIKKFATKLDDLPWARTGLIYGEKTGIPDEYSKNHHIYPQQLRNDLFPIMKGIILSKLNDFPVIFNKRSIKKLLLLVEKKNDFNFDYIERITWLVGFVFFMEKYSLLESSDQNKSLINIINSEIRLPIRYKLLYLIRKSRLKNF